MKFTELASNVANGAWSAIKHPTQTTFAAKAAMREPWKAIKSIPRELESAKKGFRWMLDQHGTNSGMIGGLAGAGLGGAYGLTTKDQNGQRGSVERMLLKGFDGASLGVLGGAIHHNRSAIKGFAKKSAVRFGMGFNKFDKQTKHLESLGNKKFTHRSDFNMAGLAQSMFAGKS